MREIRLSGSVRGADREVRPYRAPLIPMRSMVGFYDAGRDEDGWENEGPESRSPMSENPDMGHPIILGQSDLGHPPRQQGHVGATLRVCV